MLLMWKITYLFLMAALTKAGDMEHIWPMYGNDMGQNMGHIWR